MLRLSRNRRFAAPGQPVRGFRADIEGLRAVAVLLVVLSHLTRWPAGGFVGVDVFFVISGYLITGLLVREREKHGRISIREFYARRARRILPIAMLVLALTVVASRVIFTASRATQTAHDAVWAALFLANVNMARTGTDYFQQSRPPSAVQHYWSLAVEEQFYLFWPVLLILAFLVARRFGQPRGAVAVAGTVIAVVSFLWCLRLTSQAPTDAYFSTAARAWELMVGALVAMGQVHLSQADHRLRAAMAWLGLAGVTVAALTISTTTPFPGSAALLPVLATALILAAGDPAGGVGHRYALGNIVPRYVGRISYSLYLWHWPCIVLASAYFGLGNLSFYLAGGLLPLALSAASFHLLEDPIRRSTWLSKKPRHYHRRSMEDWARDNRRELDAGLLTGGALTVAFAAWLLLTPPVTDASAGQVSTPAVTQTNATQAQPNPLADTIRASLTADHWGTLTPSLDNLPGAVAPEWRPDNCVNVSDANLRACSYGKGTKTAVIVGDSYAVSWAPAVKKALIDQGWRVQLLTHGQCPVPSLTFWRDAANKPYTECDQHREWMFGQVERIKPDLVVVNSTPEYVDHIVGQPSQASDNNAVLWQNALGKSLDRLKPNTKRIVIVGGTPGSKNLEDCGSQRDATTACASDLRPEITQTAKAEKAAAAAAGVTYVDVQPWFCAGGRCPAVIGTTPVYWDGRHMTRQYAESLAPLLAPSLLS